MTESNDTEAALSSTEGSIKQDAPVRVAATPEALALIEELEAEYGPVMFHQSGGCCDGASPMCFPVGDFQTNDADVNLGKVGSADFFISGPQFDIWKHTQLILDAVPGRGANFSLENGRGKRFDIRSRVLSETEKQALASRACEMPQRSA